MKVNKQTENQQLAIDMEIDATLDVASSKEELAKVLGSEIESINESIESTLDLAGTREDLAKSIKSEISAIDESNDATMDVTIAKNDLTDVIESERESIEELNKRNQKLTGAKKAEQDVLTKSIATGKNRLKLEQELAKQKPIVNYTEIQSDIVAALAEQLKIVNSSNKEMSQSEKYEKEMNDARQSYTKAAEKEFPKHQRLFERIGKNLERTEKETDNAVKRISVGALRAGGSFLSEKLGQFTEQHILGGKQAMDAYKFVRQKSDDAREKKRQDLISKSVDEKMSNKRNNDSDSAFFMGPRPESNTTPTEQPTGSTKPVYVDDTGEKKNHKPQTDQIVRKLDVIAKELQMINENIVKMETGNNTRTLGLFGVIGSVAAGIMTVLRGITSGIGKIITSALSSLMKSFSRPSITTPSPKTPDVDIESPDKDDKKGKGKGKGGKTPVPEAGKPERVTGDDFKDSVKDTKSGKKGGIFDKIKDVAKKHGGKLVKGAGSAFVRAAPALMRLAAIGTGPVGMAASLVLPYVIQNREELWEKAKSGMAELDKMILTPSGGSSRQSSEPLPSVEPSHIGLEKAQDKVHVIEEQKEATKQANLVQSITDSSITSQVINNNNTNINRSYGFESKYQTLSDRGSFIER